MAKKIINTGSWSATGTWQGGGPPASGSSPGTGQDVAVSGVSNATSTANLGSLMHPYNFRNLDGSFAANNVTINVQSGYGIDFYDIQGSGTLNVTVGLISLFWVTHDIQVNALNFSDTAGQVALVGHPGTYSKATVNFNNTRFGDVVIDTGATGSSQPTLTNINGDYIALGTTDVRGISYSAVTGEAVSGVAGDYTVTVTAGSSSYIFNHVGFSGPASAITLQNDPRAGNVLAVYFGVVCFAAGTRILTATGERMVETLLQGDIVLTLAGNELRAQPIKWIGRRRIDIASHPRPETVEPIRIQRAAFTDSMPHSDLLVSPDHAVVVDGKLICARQLINGTTIRQEKNRRTVDYYHVELDTHAILLAEGLPAESYLNTGNRGFFANSGEPLVLHPDLTDETDHPTRAAASCVPFAWDEAQVRPVWQRLADRAAALGRPVPQFDTTTDAELRIVASGSRSLRPVYGENGLYVFMLPQEATEVRVVSRAGSPTDARPWLDDRRFLGVHVERIVLRGASETREIPLDHPSLSRGWWAVEQDGTAMRRWTNGDAVLPLPAMDGPTMLEIRASNGGMSYVTAAEPDRRVA